MLKVNITGHRREERAGAVVRAYPWLFLWVSLDFANLIFRSVCLYRIFPFDLMSKGKPKGHPAFGACSKMKAIWVDPSEIGAGVRQRSWEGSFRGVALLGIPSGRCFRVWTILSGK